jgi:hypothetical protein
VFLHVENTPRNPNVANAKRGIRQKKKTMDLNVCIVLD